MVRKHTRPRTRTRPSDWGVASVTACAARAARAGMAAPAQDVAAPADKREGRCASPDGQSAHRPLMSFARSGTTLSRSADSLQPNRRRAARLVRRRHVPPAPRGMPDRLPGRKQALPGPDDGGQAEVSPPLIGQSVARSTADTTASVAIEFRRASRPAAAREEPDEHREPHGPGVRGLRDQPEAARPVPRPLLARRPPLAPAPLRNHPPASSGPGCHSAAAGPPEAGLSPSPRRRSPLRRSGSARVRRSGRRGRSSRSRCPGGPRHPAAWRSGPSPPDSAAAARSGVTSSTSASSVSRPSRVCSRS